MIWGQGFNGRSGSEVVAWDRDEGENVIDQTITSII